MSVAVSALSFAHTVQQPASVASVAPNPQNQDNTLPSDSAYVASGSKPDALSDSSTGKDNANYMSNNVSGNSYNSTDGSNKTQRVGKDIGKFSNKVWQGMKEAGLGAKDLAEGAKQGWKENNSSSSGSSSQSSQ